MFILIKQRLKRQYDCSLYILQGKGSKPIEREKLFILADNVGTRTNVYKVAVNKFRLKKVSNQ